MVLGLLSKINMAFVEFDENAGYDHWEDIALKTGSMGVKGATVGGLYGTAAAAFIVLAPVETPPVGAVMVQASRAIVGNAIFGGGLASAFSLTTCLATYIRDKDDYVNYAIGGGAAGSLFGFRYRSGLLGVAFTVSAAVAMGLIKYRGIFSKPDAFGKYDESLNADLKIMSHEIY